VRRPNGAFVASVIEESRPIDGVKQAKMWLRSTRRESLSVPVVLAVPPSGRDETAGRRTLPNISTTGAAMHGKRNR
jgi:hypothetical protein